MSKLELNGTKIMHHPRALANWVEGKPCYPIQVEISPTNACNHKCAFCAYEYIPRTPSRFLDSELLLKTLQELRELETKSLFYSGEGEPLLHKGLPDIVEKAQDMEFSQALNTNGSLMFGDRMKRILPALDWVRISFNAATSEEYESVHGCRSSDYERTLNNIEAMVEFADKRCLPVVIGVQMVYMGQSTQGLRDLVIRLREYGVTYFSLKRFNQHPAITRRDCNGSQDVIESLHGLATDSFHVAVRDNMGATSPRRYDHCHGMAFYAEIISNGDVYSCGPHLGNKDFCYGNIADQSFRELWSPESRSKVHQRIKALGRLDDVCMPNCRIHAVNNYLWDLSHPPQHVNFI